MEDEQETDHQHRADVEWEPSRTKREIAAILIESYLSFCKRQQLVIASALFSELTNAFSGACTRSFRRILVS